LEGADLTGYEIELLRDLGARILAAHGINAKPTITYIRRVWGEKFFRLLEQDGAVDVIASAISITPEREKTYGLVFTDPTLQYPQTMIAKPGVQPFVDGKLVLNRVAAAEKDRWRVARRPMHRSSARPASPRHLRLWSNRTNKPLP
jgi:hypothetical protein